MWKGSFLFDDCEKLGDKLAFVLVLRRTFEVNVAEYAAQFQAVFVCVIDEFLTGFGDILIRSVMEEGYRFHRRQVLHELAFAALRNGNAIVNILWVVDVKFVKIRVS